LTALRIVHRPKTTPKSFFRVTGNFPLDDKAGLRLRIKTRKINDLICYSLAAAKLSNGLESLCNIALTELSWRLPTGLSTGFVDKFAPPLP
jgi:hypothetical protein